MRLSGWGRHPVADTRLVEPRDLPEALARIAEAPAIPRGNGRSYGDAALNRERVLSLRRLNRLLEFDPSSGWLRCEGGVLLRDILQAFVPLGWFPAVTPGTQFVTVGGMIASDVHGKNHHKDGTFGRHVRSLELGLADGRLRSCSRETDRPLFEATCGGMGLTGAILRAELQLRPIETAYMRQETLVAPDLDSAMEAFQASGDWTYTVGWIDCLAGGGRLGRSIVFRGEHARRDELPARLSAEPFHSPAAAAARIPLEAPGWALNRFSVGAFNALYYRRQAARRNPQLVPYQPFFYPLDSLQDWNRIYGRRGFVQFQCVLPQESSREGLRTLLERIRRSGQGSFLAVLKLMGPGGEGMLSFPRAGYTLALDFPLRAGTAALYAELEAITRDFGGRLYLTKDALMQAESLAAGYPRLEEFREVLAGLPAPGHFHSMQSQRLGLTGRNPMSTDHASDSAPVLLVLGAGSDLGLACAREFARRGYDLQLAARRPEQLEDAARDLRLRSGRDVQVLQFDALATDTHAGFYAALRPKPDVVLCTVGLMTDQRAAEADFAAAEAVVRTNYLGPMSILNLIAADFESRGRGGIIGVSSMAGERGRKSNYIYGSAKAGFTAFLSGLRNRLHSRGVQVMTVSPGFIETKMTAGLDLPPGLTLSAEEAARRIYAAFQRRRETTSLTFKWELIRCIIRGLPEPLFKRTSL